MRGGQLVWSGAAGTVDGRADGHPAGDDTQYRMGSITKTFVAVCVLRLRDAGRLELTDRFGAHVPGSALDDVTVEQLLTHAAGTQAETPGPWWERTPGGNWDALVASPVGRRFRAGRRFHYSNVGYAALGRLLEVAHGRCWLEVVRDELARAARHDRARPRGPRGRRPPGSAVHPFADVLLPEPEHDAGAMAPAGQLWTTVTDLARWATFLGGDTAPTCCRPTHSPRWSSRTTSSTTPGSPGWPPTGWASRCGTSTVRGSPGTAGRCPASSPACGSGWMPVPR